MLGGKPITLLKMIDPAMRFPRKLRLVFACLYLQQDLKGRPCNRFIIKGPRGGGKSKLLGALGFTRWYLLLRRIVNLGGSLEQAKGVLMARHSITADKAFERLRDHSQHSGRKLSDVAAAVVESHLLLLPQPQASASTAPSLP